jgi:hypothetical protein
LSASSESAPAGSTEWIPDGLADLRAYLDHFWDQALAAYKTAVEQHARESE